MTTSILKHPLWPEIRPFVVIQFVPQDEKAKHKRPRFRIEIKKVPMELAVKALNIEIPCPSCKNPYHPIRARKAPAKRGDPPAKGLYYASGCPLNVRMGCSRGMTASLTYDAIHTDIQAWRQST